MKKVTASGKTIDEAVKNGLEQLGTTADRVTVNVLEQPSRGLFGLFARAAKVELTLIEEQAGESAAEAARPPIEEADGSAAAEVLADAVGSESEAVDDSEPNGREIVETPPKSDKAGDAVEAAERFLKDVANAMGLSIEIERIETRDGMKLAMSSDGDVGLLIGRRGQTLDALQYLANIVSSRRSRSHARIVLDAENFRERRRKTLEELSDRLARRVVRSGEDIVLEPMPPLERKIIHMKLQNHPKVTTYSTGEEPNRRIVITLK